MLEQTSGLHNQEDENLNLCIKQVELNTISISAISSSCRASSLHRYDASYFFIQIFTWDALMQLLMPVAILRSLERRFTQRQCIVYVRKC